MRALPDAIPSLTRAASQGDERAFDQLYERYYGRVLGYVRALVGKDRERVRDVVQDTWLRVVRYLRPCPDEAMFWGWLRRLARTAATDRARRERKHRGLVPWTPQPGAERPDPLELSEALDRLPAEERELLEARYVEGYTTGELADRLGCSPKAVESRLARLRKKARRLLRRWREAVWPRRKCDVPS